MRPMDVFLQQWWWLSGGAWQNMYRGFFTRISSSSSCSAGTDARRVKRSRWWIDFQLRICKHFLSSQECMHCLLTLVLLLLLIVFPIIFPFFFSSIFYLKKQNSKCTFPLFLFHSMWLSICAIAPEKHEMNWILVLSICQMRCSDWSVTSLYLACVSS